MNKEFIIGFLKQAQAHDFSALESLALLKQSNTGWFDQFLGNSYDRLRAGASHAANDARIGFVGPTAGGVRDFFSAANPFGSGDPISYFSNFGERMGANEQARRAGKGELFADIARNSAVNGSLDRANEYGQMAQGEGNMLTNSGSVNNIANSLNTTRNIAGGIQMQTDRIKQESADQLGAAQNKLNTPFNLNAPKSPAGGTPPPNVTPSPTSVSDAMRKPLFSLGDQSGKPNVKI